MPDLLQEAAAAYQAGRWDEAETLCRRVLSQAPGDVEARRQLGRLAHQRGRQARAQGNLTAALIWLQQAVELIPREPQAHNDLIGALNASQQRDQALAAVRQALQLWPGDPHFLNVHAFVLVQRGDSAAAAAAYREVIRVCPDQAATHAELGLVLLHLGEVEEARAALEQALLLDPRYPAALTSLANLLRQRLPEQHLAAAQEVLADRSIPGARRGLVAYAMGQVHDARQEYARAVEWVQQAHACFLEQAGQLGQAYDANAYRLGVEQTVTAYTPAYFERVRGWGDESVLPVFIVGMPRSGTTLAEQILAGHPQVFGAGELTLIVQCNQSIPERLGRMTSPLACLDQLTPALVRQLAGHYLGQLRTHHATADRIIDKLPDNYQNLGLIATLLPRARIIHLRRDLRDVGLSCWMTAFRSILWTLQEEHIRERIRGYVRLMEHWRRVLPVPMLEVDYEELVTDTEGVARRMVQFCGLEWDSACLATHETWRDVRTASRLQVREPIYQRSVGRWRHYEPFLGLFFAALAELQTRFTG
jgi:tetratricopeptide (TPR) repeat protein